MWPSECDLKCIFNGQKCGEARAKLNCTGRLDYIKSNLYRSVGEGKRQSCRAHFVLAIVVVNFLARSYPLGGTTL